MKEDCMSIYINIITTVGYFFSKINVFILLITKETCSYSILYIKVVEILTEFLHILFQNISYMSYSHENIKNTL